MQQGRALQLIANAIILLLVNMIGLFIYYPTEMVQRKAFQETRTCIQTRMRIQRENEKQVGVAPHAPRHQRVASGTTVALRLAQTYRPGNEERHCQSAVVRDHVS
jgi:hypothetical protein